MTTTIVEPVTLVHNNNGDGDWEGIYLGSTLMTQQHSIDARTLLDALDIDYQEIDATQYLEKHSDLPKSLDILL